MNSVNSFSNQYYLWAISDYILQRFGYEFLIQNEYWKSLPRAATKTLTFSS